MRAAVVLAFVSGLGLAPGFGHGQEIQDIPFDPATAPLQWRYESDPMLYFWGTQIKSVVALRDGALVLDTVGRVFRLDPEGHEQWRSEVIGWPTEEAVEPDLLPVVEPAGFGALIADSERGLYRLSAEGKRLWRRKSGEHLNLDYVTAMTATTDGGFLVGGIGFTGDERPRLCGQTGILKLDANGRILWRWDWYRDGRVRPYYNFLVSLRPLKDGNVVAVINEKPSIGVYFTGRRDDPCLIEELGDHRSWLLWLDSAGRTRRLRGLPQGHEFTGVAELPDGRVVVAGAPIWEKKLRLFIFSAYGDRLLAERWYGPGHDPDWPQEVEPRGWHRLRIVGNRLSIGGLAACYDRPLCIHGERLSLELSLEGEPFLLLRGPAIRVSLFPDPDRWAYYVVRKDGLAMGPAP